ncbi:glucosyltransferase domain-containing protein [Proteus mirabilis]|uniref:glucosyltransferase domain-containing protein n=1 Tax=Proteus mirabilis TaxID=584 RepID=UPI0023F906DB|nr:glucosyltransferase domain-containing protein [Proteus mirabilis]MDF7473915.1 glucosyltransferase domain-containing protein [Proteus mirabilis]
MTNNNLYIRCFYYLMAIAFVYYIPLILSDLFYIDDIGRSIYGYANWIYNGRPLADIIMITLSFGSPIIDLSPLPQVLSVIILCACVIFLIKSISNDNRVSFIIIASTALLINPFYLENMSYKFDSLPMTLSVCALMACFFINKKGLFGLLIGTLLITLSLSLYQASIGCFIGISIMESCFKIKEGSLSKNNDTLYKTILLRIIQLIFGYAVYSIFISKHTLSGEYNIAHSELIFGNTEEITTSFRNNFNIFSYKLYEAIKPIKLIFLSGVALCYYSYSLIIIKMKRDGYKKHDILIRSSILLLSPILILLSGFIHLCFLKHPVISPRVYISICVFMMYFAISICWIKKPTYLPYVFVLLFFSYFFVFNYSYVNTLKSQNRVDEFIIKSIANELHPNNDKINKISVIGIIPQSRQREYISKKFPLIDELVPLYMNNGWAWGSVLLAHYGKDYFFENATIDDIANICQRGAPDVNKGDYNIYYINDKAVIVLQKPIC